MNAAMITAIATLVTATLAGITTLIVQLVKVIPDAKLRRKATSDEHDTELAELAEIKKMLAAKESREVRALKKRVAELEKQLAEAEQTKIIGT